MTENGAWLRAWCAFGSVSGLPMGDFLRLIRETGGPEEAADAPYATHLKILGAKGADALRRARDEEVFEATKAWLERCPDAHVWTVLDEDFPVRFLHAERSPLCLFVRGNRRLLSGTVLLVAGDGADEETLYNTAEFSRSVLEAGYVPSYANRSALEKVGIRAIISSRRRLDAGGARPNRRIGSAPVRPAFAKGRSLRRLPASGIRRRQDRRRNLLSGRGGGSRRPACAGVRKKFVRPGSGGRNDPLGTRRVCGSRQHSRSFEQGTPPFDSPGGEVGGVRS